VVLHRAVGNTSDKFYCALSQLPSRYPNKSVSARGQRVDRLLGPSGYFALGLARRPTLAWETCSVGGASLARA
jgi:hypothetical protein